MHRHRLSATCVGVVLFSLIFLPCLAQAETLAAPANLDANAPLRIEAIVTGYAGPQKPGTSKSGEAFPDLSGQATQSALDKAIMMNNVFAAKWPKCHFHIASLVAESLTSANNQPLQAVTTIPGTPSAQPPHAMPQPKMLSFMADPPFAVLHVTFVGEHGCLTSAK